MILGKDGNAPSEAMSKDNVVVFYFRRVDVPFKYAEKSPGKGAFPLFSARMLGNSLVLDKPLPVSMLISESIKVKKKTSDEFDVDQGGKIVIRLNKWLRWAEDNGYNPEVGKVGNSVRIKLNKMIKQEWDF